MRCDRCGHDAKNKTCLVKHLSRKNACEPLVKNVSRAKLLKKHSKQHGGFGGYTFVCLGAHGGLCSGNISAYLLKFGDSANYICLDGGSPIDGIWEHNKQYPNNIISPTENIEAYLISHAHLDHMAGFAIATPAYYGKLIKVIAYQKVLDAFNDHIFNDVLWPKILWTEPVVGPDGKETGVKKLPIDQSTHKLEKSNFTISAMPVQHGNYPANSTVFFVEANNGETVVYFGDVSDVPHASFGNAVSNNNAAQKNAVNPRVSEAFSSLSVTDRDKYNKSRSQLDAVWDVCAKLIDESKLVAIFIECAFPNKGFTGAPNKMLFGHLNANLLANEFKLLKTKTSSQSFGQIKVVITHRKPTPMGPSQYALYTISELRAQLANDPSTKLTDKEKIKVEIGKTFVDTGLFNENDIVFPQQGKEYRL